MREKQFLPTAYHALRYLGLIGLLLMMACAEPELPPTVFPTEAVPPTATLAPTPVPTKDLPRITAVSADRTELPNYESIELLVDLDAEYDNPYDMREVTLGTGIK